MTVLQGTLADRDAWSAVGECPIEKTMALLGTKSAMLIMREAYYGTTRFDDFWRRIGVTKAAAAARLSDLVEAGLLERRPYREPGQRSRDEYVLTDAGLRLHAGGMGDVRVGPAPPAKPDAAAADPQGVRRRRDRHHPLRRWARCPRQRARIRLARKSS